MMSVALGISSDSLMSLACKRLYSAIHRWDLEKSDQNYRFLYICARYHGKKIKKIWVEPHQPTTSTIEKSMGDSLAKATSFDVEFLFSEQEREIDLKITNQWNSLRGKKAAIITYLGHETRWSGLDMISGNLSFSRIAKKHLILVGPGKVSKQHIPVRLFDTKQFYCSNTESKNQKDELSGLEPSTLYRGSQLTGLGSINKESLFVSIKAMAHWLSSQVNKEGRAEYKYWPSRGTFSSSNNAIRQWMATVCLNRVARAFNDDALYKVAEQNLRYNITSMYRVIDSVGCIWMNGSAKLGAASLAALSIIESPKRKEYLRYEYALYDLIKRLTNDDGSFNSFYIPSERNDNQNFYSGEALLFLAYRYSISGNPAELESIMRGFQYYRIWHLNNRNPAFIPWHTQAYYLVWEITRDESLKSFIFEMNDWLLTMQQWDSTEYLDMKGRFYDPGRPYYGPPHASSTGVYLEGLIDAYKLAKYCNDLVRSEKYRVAILRGIRSIMQLQFKTEEDCYYINKSERVMGGVRTTVYDNTIRIDNVQHSLMAFVKIYHTFIESDYDSSSDVHSLRETFPNELVEKYKDSRSYVWNSGCIERVLKLSNIFNKKYWESSSVASRNYGAIKGSLCFARTDSEMAVNAARRAYSGCSAIVAEAGCAKNLAKDTSVTIYEVDSMLEAARTLSDFSRVRTDAKIVGVTGSVGKTSVKDALTHILSTQGKTQSTNQNANDGWGVLDTLMNLKSESEFSVMELGMLGAGSIEAKSNRVRPHVGLITNIHDSHMSYHKSALSIAKTKSDIMCGMSSDGVIILPADSAWFDYLIKRARYYDIKDVLTFGKSKEADCRLVKSYQSLNKNIIEAEILGKKRIFEVGVSGRHWAKNIMSVLAGVFAVGGDVEYAIEQLNDLKPSHRRGEILSVSRPPKQYTVIDDSWNASPVSVAASIENMSSYLRSKEGKKVLFLGDMLQLGEDEVRKHVRLSDVILRNGVEKVITVGSLTRHLFEALPASIKIDHFTDSKSASRYAESFVENGDVVLVKGSNAMNMWRIVSSLKSI